MVRLWKSTAAASMVAGLAAAALVGAAPPASAARPTGTSGPVIFNAGTWRLRTTPTSGPAQLTFSFGNAADFPVPGDWDGNGTETVGVARINESGTFQWFLRNANSSGPHDLTFSFGQLGAAPNGESFAGHPVAGNFDPSDDAYEVGDVFADPTSGHLVWTIRRDLTATSPTTTFVYGLVGDQPVIGDWDGDGVETAGVVRNNTWLLTNAQLQGGAAATSFTFGSPNLIPEYKAPGDWNGDGTDTPGVVRNNPVNEFGGFEVWLTKDTNTGGAADSSFVFGNDSFTPDVMIFFIPRLTIQVQ